MIDRAALISDAYLQTQRVLHGDRRGYGGKGHKWAPTVLALAASLGASSVLDYGCGEGALGAALRATKPSTMRVAEYDPAIPGKDMSPSFADLVVCTDVLEHIEPACLDAVLQHLHLLVRRAAFLVIALDPSGKVLTDGRNAHVIQESPAWWQARLEAAHFRCTDVDSAVPVHLAPEKRAKRWLTLAVPA